MCAHRLSHGRSAAGLAWKARPQFGGWSLASDCVESVVRGRKWVRDTSYASRVFRLDSQPTFGEASVRTRGSPARRSRPNIRNGMKNQ